MFPKELAIETLRELPGEATWREIEERIQFVAAIEKGREDIRLGRAKTHEEVRRAFQEWMG